MTPDVDTEPLAYEATLVHCELIRRKIDQLHQTLRESMGQLYICADREYRDGHVTLDDLGALYQRARGLGPGFAGLWSDHMSITPSDVRHHMQYHPPVPNGERQHYWSGPYPYDRAAPRPLKGVAVVYVLYDAMNEPVYLGSTGAFADRMRAHRKKGKQFVWWLAYPCGTREAAYLLEGGLLAARKPPLNIKVGR
jgi:hypothetical protein